MSMKGSFHSSFHFKSTTLQGDLRASVGGMLPGNLRLMEDIRRSPVDTVNIPIPFVYRVYTSFRWLFGISEPLA